MATERPNGVRPVNPEHPPALTLRQRFYLVEVLAGLALTARHFFANMGRRCKSNSALGRSGDRCLGRTT